MATSDKPLGHPAPHRNRVSSPVLLLAIVAAPAAWLVQLIVDYGLAAHRCFPHDEALMTRLSGSRIDVVILNIAAIAVAVAGSVLARRIWRDTREEQGGSAHHLLETAEGRTRFLAMCGQIAGLGFLIAILFDTVAIFVVPQCFG